MKSRLISQDDIQGGVVETDRRPSGDNLIMDSILSLDDGRWQNPIELHSSENMRNDLQMNIIRQPSPPPVLAQVQHTSLPIPPSKVADPRPGPTNLQNGPSDANSYQELHIVRSPVAITLLWQISILDTPTSCAW